jgi:hypothetical protein
MSHEYLDPNMLASNAFLGIAVFMVWQFFSSVTILGVGGTKKVFEVGRKFLIQ